MSVSATECVVCGSARLERRAAVISGFISEYALKKPPALSEILKCRDCTMLFYALRPSEAEMERLYGAYRGEEYFRIRHKHEFWYTRRFHAALGSETVMPARRQRLLASLAKYRDLDSFETVLDYGGDRGQLLTDGPGRKRFVFEMSDAVPEPSIEKIMQERDLQAGGYDLVLLFHALEHVSAPLEIVAKLKKLLSPGGLLFIEVPQENFAIKNIPKSEWYRKYLSFVIKHIFLLSLLSFYSVASRVQFRCIPPLGFAIVHEHINYFTLHALKTCLVKSGLAVQDVFYDNDTGNLCAIACLQR